MIARNVRGAHNLLDLIRENETGFVFVGVKARTQIHQNRSALDILQTL